MRSDLIDIATLFLTWAEKHELDIRELKSGLINQSYKVKTSESCYVLQKVNDFIFHQPIIIHNNYNRVREELLSNDYSKQIVSFLEDDKGQQLKKLDGEYWRMSRFIDGETCDICINPIMAYNSAKALAEFHCCTKGIKIKELKEPIPRFCDFSYRLIEFEESLISGDADRIKTANKLIKAINSNLHHISDYVKIENKIKKRVLHGDPKVSNFLFDKSFENVIALIDIDTIMPGSILYDFGDLVRSFANQSLEDSSIVKDSFDLKIYNALYEGYLSIGKTFLSYEEIKSMKLAANAVSLVQCIRFLTDYLKMDNYYHVNAPQQNFNRALNQFDFFNHLKNKA